MNGRVGALTRGPVGTPIAGPVGATGMDDEGSEGATDTVEMGLGAGRLATGVNSLVVSTAGRFDGAAPQSGRPPLSLPNEPLP